MTFIESIKTCFRKYADFEGRASRSEYWWFFLFCSLVSAGTTVVECASLDECYQPGVFSWLWILATLLPIYAAGARRLHDMGHSGWWQLLAIPYWFGFAMPDVESAGIMFLIGLVIMLPVIVMLCVRTWTKANKYGELPVTK